MVPDDLKAWRAKIESGEVSLSLSLSLSLCACLGSVRRSEYGQSND